MLNNIKSSMTLEIVTKSLTKKSPLKELLFWYEANTFVCNYSTWESFYNSLPEGEVQGGEVA